MQATVSEEYFVIHMRKNKLQEKKNEINAKKVLKAISVSIQSQ